MYKAFRNVSKLDIPHLELTDSHSLNDLHSINDIDEWIIEANDSLRQVFHYLRNITARDSAVFEENQELKEKLFRLETHLLARRENENNDDAENYVLLRSENDYLRAKLDEKRDVAPQIINLQKKLNEERSFRRNLEQRLLSGSHDDASDEFLALKQKSQELEEAIIRANRVNEALEKENKSLKISVERNREHCDEQTSKLDSETENLSKILDPKNNADQSKPKHISSAEATHAIQTFLQSLQSTLLSELTLLTGSSADAETAIHHSLTSLQTFQTRLVTYLNMLRHDASEKAPQQLRQKCKFVLVNSESATTVNTEALGFEPISAVEQAAHAAAAPESVAASSGVKQSSRRVTIEPSIAPEVGKLRLKCRDLEQKLQRAVDETNRVHERWRSQIEQSQKVFEDENSAQQELIKELEQKLEDERESWQPERQRLEMEVNRREEVIDEVSGEVVVF